MWLGWVAVAVAAPDAAALSAAWETRRGLLDTHAVYPFRFSEQEWAALSKGEVLKRRDRLDGTDRVLGVLWVDDTVDRTWLAIHDPHGAAAVEEMVYEVLPGSTPVRQIVYQRIGLPWPLASRQWVIETTNNLGLMGASAGAVWERTWRLSDQRGAKNESATAVWLPVNEGGWFLADVAGGTLLGYHVRTAIGGMVPEEAALRWSFSTLDGMLTRISGRTTWVRDHYVTGHAPVTRPDGTAIPVP